MKPGSTFDIDLPLEAPEERAGFKPIQQRQFSGIQTVTIPDEAAVAKLRSGMARHRQQRPAMPWPLPAPGTAERADWDQKMQAWVLEKDRLASELEQAEGLLRSAWRPCEAPAHALNPAQPTAPSTTAIPRPTRPDSKPVSAGTADQGAEPRRRRAPSNAAPGASAPSTPGPVPEAEPLPPPVIGRPRLQDTDDPKILHRREQYRRSAAKQQKARAAARSGVIR